MDATTEPDSDVTLDVPSRPLGTSLTVWNWQTARDDQGVASFVYISEDKWIAIGQELGVLGMDEGLAEIRFVGEGVDPSTFRSSYDDPGLVLDLDQATMLNALYEVPEENLVELQRAFQAMLMRCDLRSGWFVAGANIPVNVLGPVPLDH